MLEPRIPTPQKIDLKVADTPDDLLRAAKELSELGWPVEDIARELHLDLTDAQFIEATAAGAEIFKECAKRQSSWRPKTADLIKVREYAKNGNTEAATAAKLNVTRACFQQRLTDTPQLRAAFDQGNGEYQVKRLKEWNHMLDIQDPALKTIGQAYRFTLEALCGLSDKPSTVKVEVSGETTVNHSHRLSAPPPVPMRQIADFAKVEMERANAIAAEKMRLLPKPEDAIEAEVREVAE